MNIKIVYVVVSSVEDIYLEQAYISMFSVKYYMSNAHIVLLTDRITSETFKGIRKKELEFADEIVVVDLDGNKWTALQRSRLLKTSIRNLIDGDFLYIDSDTIVVRSLDYIEKFEAIIAACRDGHCNFKDHPVRKLCLDKCMALNWPAEQETDYFNGGVMYVKDVPKTHEFFQRWNKNLIEGFEKFIMEDQAALAKTNYEMGHIITKLPDEWNCQVLRGIRYLKDAYIVHYLCTIPSEYQNKQLFILNEKSVLLDVKATGKIGKDIMDAIRDPFKGLAESTHTLSGEDLHFIYSQYYHFVRSHYKREGRSKILLCIRVLNFIERLVKRYIRILQGRATFKTDW